MVEIDVHTITERLQHHAHMQLAGANPTTHCQHLGDPTPVTLWRKFRDGTETTEPLPHWLAHLTLLQIPFHEPLVARAKILHEASNTCAPSTPRS